MDAAPTVTTALLTAPSPGVRVTVSSMAGSAVTVTVRRTGADGASAYVRGALDSIVAGTFFVDDYECPIGEQSTYSSYTTNNVGEVSTESAGTNITVTQSGTLSWLSDPLTPNSAVAVRLQSFPDRSMSIESAILSVIGSATPVMVAGVRQRGAGSIAFLTMTLAETQALRSVLLSTPIVLYRAPDPSWDIGAVFLGMGDVVEKRVGAIQDPVRIFTGAVTFITRPAASVNGPIHTYAELTAHGYTYRNLSDANLTYLQMAQRGGL
jgi:hypothetical protein